MVDIEDLVVGKKFQCGEFELEIKEVEKELVTYSITKDGKFIRIDARCKDRFIEGLAAYGH